MRKFGWMLFLSAVLCCMPVSAFAMENDTAFFDENEYNEIKNAIYSTDDLYINNVLPENAVTYTVETGDPFKDAYKIYSLNTTDFLSAIESGKKMDELFSADYVWEVTTDADQTIRVGNKNGEWEVLGYRTPTSATVESDVVKVDVLEALVAELKESEMVESATTDCNITVKCFGADRYYTNFAYVSGEIGEFLVPFGGRPDLTGLNNGEMYTIEEVCNILTESFADKTAARGNGGGRSLYSMFGMYTNAVVMIVLGVMLLAGLFIGSGVIRHKKRVS